MKIGQKWPENERQECKVIFSWTLNSLKYERTKECIMGNFFYLRIKQYSNLFVVTYVVVFKLNLFYFLYTHHKLVFGFQNPISYELKFTRTLVLSQSQNPRLDNTKALVLFNRKIKISGKLLPRNSKNHFVTGIIMYDKF